MNQCACGAAEHVAADSLCTVLQAELLDSEGVRVNLLVFVQLFGHLE